MAFSRSARTAASIFISCLAANSAFACATCGCSLSTDAAMGYSAHAGWQIGLQYDYIDQDQLRHGTHGISRADVANINDTGGDQEVENKTTNRYATLSVLYAPDAAWNFRLLVPYVDRTHSTYDDIGNPLTPADLSSSSFKSLGDIKFITSFQGLLPTHNLGIQLGVKLPTGHYGGPNAAGTGVTGNHPAAFKSGPISTNASPDNLLDTSLQAGTGSTDLIVGAYFYQAISQNFDAFVDGQFQAAIMQKLDNTGEDYRPGNLFTMSTGLRYEANPVVVPQIQLNLTHRSRDRGALADSGNSSGTALFLSPGVTFGVGHGVNLYGFVQLPIYSKLSGYQLFPRWTATAGLNYAF